MSPPKTASKSKNGFVVLFGRSNVGKSTLLNALVGSKVSIVSPKPQTTRYPIRGIYQDSRGQIVFVDTPGIFLGLKDRLSQRLHALAVESLQGIDAIVYVVDPTREQGKEEASLQTLIRHTSTPAILAINKCDLPSSKTPFLYDAQTIDVHQRATLKISALKQTSLKPLIDTIFVLLPKGEPYYPEGQFTDLTHERWIEEVIREKIFLELSQELPYSIVVKLEEELVRANGVRVIRAVIWTTQERYKKMIIGRNGAQLKAIGVRSRKELESAMNNHMHLSLDVRVDPKLYERF